MKIKPSTYIRNDYSELSSYCKETSEPIYITKNGEGDLVVMSVESANRLQESIYGRRNWGGAHDKKSDKK